METKHTPGPWDYGVIRDVLEFQPEWEDVSSDRLDADALLIAAAPELLAALENLVFDCEAHGLDDNDAHLREARVAIAKAKGE